MTEITIAALLPHRDEGIDVAAVVAAETRTPHPDRPWVYTNMVTTLDGATAVDGVSGGLGGPADRLVFTSLRAVADVILVGSSTVIAENYRNPGTDAAEARAARGQRPSPRLAILSRSLDLPVDHRAFEVGEGQERPLIVTHGQAPAERREALADVADFVVAGDESLDLTDALRQLRALGHERALLEGGPTINGAFAGVRAIDEWNLSISPLLAAGGAARPAHGPELEKPIELTLARLFEGGGLLFGRWVRTAD